MCKKHFAHTDTYQDVKKHRCVKNYEGTSKGMEAQALVEMLERAPEKYNVSICTIFSDDDSNGRVKAQHDSNGGQLTQANEEPSFLADPSHRKRVFAHAIYNLTSAPKKARLQKGWLLTLTIVMGPLSKEIGI
jgi:hypothetical protein